MYKSLFASQLQASVSRLWLSVGCLWITFTTVTCSCTVCQLCVAQWPSPQCYFSCGFSVSVSVTVTVTVNVMYLLIC